MDAIRFAAYHAPEVALKMGVFREWKRGDPDVLREIAAALPSFVGLMERQQRERRY